MKRCMLDLETLGTSAGCVVLSIGAVMFDEVSGDLGAKFYVEINQNSCTEFKLEVNTATWAWWVSQDDSAKQLLYRTSGRGGVQLDDALAMFEDWLRSQYNTDKIEIWANGADFDPPILSRAYSAIGVETPWKFWNNRCYRTMKNLFPRHQLRRVGVHHNALDDAISQARHLIPILREALPENKPSVWQRIIQFVK